MTPLQRDMHTESQEEVARLVAKWRRFRYLTEADKQRLANIDDEDFLRQIINEANRANTTFYPIDPRGLPASDTARSTRP